ncbi:hypothetical protein [Kitasatospora sp. MMS16-BH015]|uniref:hypothetical protein n=1 Tax=Kitasatospora sp. MMS16-BH015 TaxID=2018025 RepID=UPI000CF2790F|nr:hypothetical protein [Kitasatospora sp. MMS16-BH015]
MSRENVIAVATAGQRITGWWLLFPFAFGVAAVLWGLSVVIGYNSLTARIEERARDRAAQRTVNRLVGYVFLVLGAFMVVSTLVQGVAELI